MHWTPVPSTSIEYPSIVVGGEADAILMRS
jgi:hypothetical protein